MNKRLYRIVFNKARGMLMAVAEITRSHRASVAPSSGSGSKISAQLTATLTPITFGVLLAFSPVSSVMAGVVADRSAPGNQQPQIFNSANGTPQVNIQTPSGAGVSHNTYTQFDVDKHGLILNNSHANTQTQIAGMVAANPNLAKSEAKVILNEVNARDPSKLNGYIEVAGRKAQVVIANPSGIGCDGCGFINANRATLTTGQVRMNNGQIAGYDVNKGEIVVQGAGMDSSTADSTDLIARAVKINAGVWAKDLKVTAGHNQVDAAHNTVTAKASDGSTSPTVAIDVAALGGMYANKIRLIGTENGVGVHNAGNIGAAAGDVTISADGSLSNSGAVTASQNLQVTTQGNLDNQGHLYASGGTTATVRGDIHNDGIIAAQGDTQLTASTINSRGGSTLAAGVKSDGSLGTAGNLTLNSKGELATNGQNLAAGTLTARGASADLSQSQTYARQMTVQATSGDIDTTSATVAATETLTASTTKKLLNSSGSLSAGQLNLTASALDNAHGKVQQTGDSGLTLSFADGIDNTGGDIAANGNITLQTNTLNNQNGRIIAAQKSQLDLTTNSTLNNQAGTIAAGGALQLHSTGLNNDNGLLQSGSDMVIALADGNLSNRDNAQDGGIFSQGALSVKAGALDNHNGFIGSDGDAQLDTAGLTNTAGQVQIVGQAIINAANAWIDNTGGLLRSGTSLALNAATVVNHGTQADNTGIEGPTVTINSQTVNNSSGILRATDALDVSDTQSLDNRQGLISSAAALSIAGEGLDLVNTDGTLIAGSNLSLTANSLSGDGDVLSQGDMTLALQQAFLNQKNVIANGDMQFTLAGQGLTNQGVLKAGKTLTLNAASLDNQQNAEINAGENHLLLSGDLTNRGLIDGGLTHITASTLNNTGTGRLYGDHIALQANTLNNTAENGVAATIAARNALDIGVGTLNNSDHALIYSDGDLAIGGALNDSLQATGQADVLNNHSATVESTGDMALNIGQINNINDNLVTQDVLVSQTSYHTAVLSGATTRFDWADVDTSKKNKYGVHTAKMPDGTSDDTFYEYQYVESIQETQVVTSDPGKIIAGGNITINSNQVNNHDSQIVAGGVLGGVIAELNNIATAGKRVITDIGTVRRWYAKKKHRRVGGTKTSQGKSTSDYTPDPTIQTIDLQNMKWQGNTQLAGNGVVISGRDSAGDHTAIASVGHVNASPGQTVEVGQSGDGGVVRLIAPNTTLPDNSLYQFHPEASAGYLVETDPQFTNGKQWLSSDYMQDQLGIDQTMKRLGDGYYEQKLVRQQVIDLSGERYLDGYSSDEEEYKALMDSGVTFAKQYGLTPGVALTTAQMALLTSDIVWLVAQDVKLPDGSLQSVLVPQVYVHVKQGDLDGSGALLGGNTIALNVNNDLTNSGHMLGRDVTQLTADTINNRGFIGGNQLTLNARTDINNVGGTLQGGDSLTAIAGRDINSISTLSGSAENTTLDRPAGIYVQNDKGELGLQAMRDITLTASQVSNTGIDGRTLMIAGNDLNLNTLNTTHSESAQWSKGNDRTLTQSTDIGSQINGSGDVALSAGHNMNARAATVTAQNSLTAAAGNDINLTSGEAAYHLTENSHQSSGGLLSHSSITTHDEVQAQNAVGSSFGGNTIAMQAGHDLGVAGSSVTGTQDVSLAAGNNLTVTTVDESRQEDHQRKEKHSGFSGTGGIGFSVGSSSLKATDVVTTHSSAASTVGSTQGNVSLSANDALTVQGAKVLAGKDMSLSGKSVNILAAENQSTQTHTVEQKTSGLTLALSGMAGSAINTAVSHATEASSENNSRLAALDGIQSALSGVGAYQALQTQPDAANPNPQGNMFGVNLSWGTQSSKSSQQQTQIDNRGSTLTAGDNLNIHSTATDINVQGSQLQAGGNAILNAARDVNLLSAENSSSLTGSNASHGSSFGVGMNYGAGTNGISVNASVNGGNGHESGNGVTHSESTVTAGQQASIISGRDTTLTGAQVSGSQVTLNVGRNLTLTSEQDSDNYDSRQHNASAGGSVSMGGGSGGISASQNKMHSTWSSVEEQTGIFAGKEGFDVTTGSHTQLNGAVIGSTASAEHNRLETGTLGFSDIRNHAEYKVEQQSAGLSTGGDLGGLFLGNLANGLLVGMNGSDSDSSLTRSAVSEGTLTVHDTAHQQQDVANLSRDAEHANQTLSPIFDKEKEQTRLAEAQKIGEIGSQISDVIAKQGELNKQQALKDPQARAAARDALIATGNLNPTEEQINAKVSSTAEADYNIGGKYQRVAQAVTAALQGVAGGNMAQAVAGAASPYVAGIIHSQTLNADGSVNLETNAMAHAVWGAVASAAGGNSALAGASGAVSGELMGRFIADEMYPGVKPEDMTEEQKAMVSTLGTLAAGLAGGVAGGDSGSVVAGAQGGKNAVENNWADTPSTDEQVRRLSGQYSNALDGCATGDSAACAEKDKLEKAYNFLAVTAGTSMVSGPASLTVKAIGSGLTMGANATGQLLSDDPFSFQSLILAGVGGWKSAGAGYWTTAGISVGTAYLDSTMAGVDPTYSVATAAFGASLGYGAASKIEKMLIQQKITQKMGISMSKNAFQYFDEPVSPGSPIYKGMDFGVSPGIWGAATGAVVSEAGTRLSGSIVPQDSSSQKDKK